jgi:hypothetical protein
MMHQLLDVLIKMNVKTIQMIVMKLKIVKTPKEVGLVPANQIIRRIQMRLLKRLHHAKKLIFVTKMNQQIITIAAISG